MCNRAEQAALKACPVVIEEHTECDINKSKRLFYIKGYEQAEKDLALTADDIKEIDEWISVIQTSDNLTGKELYEEVLRCFMESKNK